MPEDNKRGSLFAELPDVTRRALMENMETSMYINRFKDYTEYVKKACPELFIKHTENYVDYYPTAESAIICDLEHTTKHIILDMVRSKTQNDSDKTYLSQIKELYKNAIGTPNTKRNFSAGGLQIHASETKGKGWRAVMVISKKDAMEWLPNFEMIGAGNGSEAEKYRLMANDIKNGTSIWYYIRTSGFIV